MIQRSLTDDQALFRETSARFIETVLPRTATRALHDHPVGYERTWFARTAELGWFSLLVPEELGGGCISGRPLADAALVVEELGRQVQPGPFIPMNVALATVAEHGTDPLRAEVLAAGIGGQATLTWGFADGVGRWDGGTGVTVTPEGDGYVVTGERLVQDGGDADWILVAGALAGTPVQVLVEGDADGVVRSPCSSLDLNRRFSLVRLGSVRVPAEAVLGVGPAVLELQLQRAATLGAAESVGAMNELLAMTVDYAKDRIAFGRPIGSFQALKHVMADLAVGVETAAAAVEAAIAAVDGGAPDAAEVVSMTAAFVGEQGNETAQQCLQIHGGIGYTWEHDLHLLMRRLQSNSVLYGTPTWHRARVCAHHGLTAGVATSGATVDEDLDGFRSRVEAWCAANLERRTGPVVRSAQAVSAEDVAAGHALQRRVYEAGFIGITVPQAYGGQGLTAAHQRVWNEVSGGYDVPMPGGIATAVTLGIVLPTLLAHASEEQKEDWIPKLLSGEEIWCQLLSEPGAGSDLAGILTRADRDGEAWILHGAKVWSSGAMVADVGVCLARTSWDVPKHRGLTWFKVPLDAPGVTVRPVREINGSAEFCEELLDGVTIDQDQVIGDVDGGWPIANTMLTVERGGGAVGAAGGTAPGGRGGPRTLAPDLVALAESQGLLDDPATLQLIARAHIDDWLQGQLLKRVGRAVVAGQLGPAAASMIKLRTGVVDPRRAAIAMEIAGRAGIAWPADDHDGAAPSLGFLNGRVMSIAGGSNEIQRNIISERLLGLPREPSADADKAFSEVLRDARSWGQRSP